MCRGRSREKGIESDGEKTWVGNMGENDVEGSQCQRWSGLRLSSNTRKKEDKGDIMQKAKKQKGKGRSARIASYSQFNEEALRRPRTSASP